VSVHRAGGLDALVEEETFDIDLPCAGRVLVLCEISFVLAQFESLNLACGGFWEFIDKLNPARIFVGAILSFTKPSTPPPGEASHCALALIRQMLLA
jgi:hypothetical protein